MGWDCVFLSWIVWGDKTRWSWEAYPVKLKPVKA